MTGEHVEFLRRPGVIRSTLRPKNAKYQATSRVPVKLVYLVFANEKRSNRP